MSIIPYLKTIGRGKDGARSLERAQAADLLGQVLDGQVNDLQLGAFCIAMRVKGETANEMAGFLDAIHARLQRLPASDMPLVVLPSYNGARRLPLLTPLLALLLAREGLPVLMHGTPTEDARVVITELLPALGIATLTAPEKIAKGSVRYVATHTLLPALQRLLDVRRTLGLRNTAHSLVKMMNPSHGAAVVVGSYTHPEFATLMAEVVALTQGHALLLRGTEGEPVADPRRAPRMQGFVGGVQRCLHETQAGSLAEMPDLPQRDAHATVQYIQAVMAGTVPVPESIALQVALLQKLVQETQQI